MDEGKCILSAGSQKRFVAKLHEINPLLSQKLKSRCATLHERSIQKLQNTHHQQRKTPGAKPQATDSGARQLTSCCEDTMPQGSSSSEAAVSADIKSGVHNNANANVAASKHPCAMATRATLLPPPPPPLLITADQAREASRPMSPHAGGALFESRRHEKRRKALIPVRIREILNGPKAPPARS